MSVFDEAYALSITPQMRLVRILVRFGRRVAAMNTPLQS